jgi:hypothetical protein
MKPATPEPARCASHEGVLFSVASNRRQMPVGPYCAGGQAIVDRATDCAHSMTPISVGRNPMEYLSMGRARRSLAWAMKRRR